MLNSSPGNGLGDGPTCKKIQKYIFKFSDLLGQGNFSKVYKAHHEITDQVVAIKIVELNSLKSKKLEELLFSEINVLKKLNHPNVLRCFEVFTSNRNCYIITEICNEGDLESKLRRKGHFSEEAAQPIIWDIFEGLLYLSEQNVIHRDLKVANVFMHNGKAKIADFGFAKFTVSKFKDINIGSPIYMSPQGFIDNIYGPKTDVWAFGVLIYELLHGETPFNFCKTETELKFNLSLPINRNKFRHQISSELQDVMIKCLQIDEQKRITAKELATLPYFEKLMKSQSNQIYSSSANSNSMQINIKNESNSSNEYSTQYRTRQLSSYQGTAVNKPYSSHTDKKMSPYEQQNTFNRRISVQNSSNPTVNSVPTGMGSSGRSNNLLIANSMNSFDRGSSPFNGFDRNEAQKQSMPRRRNENYFSTRNIEPVEYNFRSTNQFDTRFRERGITSEKRQMPVTRSTSIKSIDKKEGLHLVSHSRQPKIISEKLTFKQSVNLLHYARLIYKFIQLLREMSEQEIPDPRDEIQTLTKWLMLILDEVGEKIEQKEVTYGGGTNPEIRERKLVEVTSEYQKKYRRELQSELIEINRKDMVGNLNLDYIKNYMYGMYSKYDKRLFVECTKNLIFLGHNIMMIYEATRLIKKCYQERNYYLLENYKEIETFLSQSKEALDLDLYRQRRKGMSIYN